MHQPSTSFSSSTPLHIASGQGGASSAASSVVMPGVRPFAPSPYDNQGLDPAAESLSRLHEWVGTLDRYLRLPNTFQAFSVYLSGLILVFTGATLHVWVAAQIMQAQYELAALEREYVAIEQQNSELLFRIARDTNLNRMRERAVAMGYVPITEREYVVVQPDTADTLATAQAAPQTPSAAASMQADDQTLPLHQWERLLRGAVTWERPAEAARATAPGGTMDDPMEDRLAEPAPSLQPSAAGAGWQARWQQMVEQGRQFFAQIDIR